MAAKRHRLAQRRKTVGFTQEKLAEHLGVDATTIRRWESGEASPQPWIRPKLARSLQVSVEQLEELLYEPSTDDLPGDSHRTSSNTSGADLAAKGPIDLQQARQGLADVLTEDAATGAEAQSREAAPTKAYAKTQARAQELRADTGPSPSPNGNGLVLPTGQEVLGSLVSAVGAELASSLAGPLLYMALLSTPATPAQAVPIERREQLREQLRTFLCEWANTMERREHLRLLGWLAASVAASPILNLDSEEQERLSKVIAKPSRVDSQVIDHIDATLRHCQLQEDALGSRAVLPTLLDQRNLVDDLLTECPANLRARLLSTYSNMSTSIGYYFFELNDLTSARPYFEQARAAAHDAGSADLSIYALGEWSYAESWQGKAVTGIDLASIAQSLVSKAEDPLMRVGAAQRAGTAYAFDGQYKACMIEFERAQASLAAATGQASLESPAYFYNEGYLTSHMSECLLRLGKPQEAAASASAGLRQYDKSFVDGYAVCTLHLGNAACYLGEIDEAARLIGSAASLAAQTCSARLTSEVSTARKRLQPWHNAPAVKELDERLRAWGMGESRMLFLG